MKLTYLPAVLPLVGIFGGISVASRVEPFVLGMLSTLSQIALWVVLAPMIVATIYGLDPANKEDEAR